MNHLSQAALLVLAVQQVTKLKGQAGSKLRNSCSWCPITTLLLSEGACPDPCTSFSVGVSHLHTLYLCTDVNT